jgi:hypothetical protein
VFFICVAALRHTSLGFFRILWSTLGGYIIVNPSKPLARLNAEC